MFVSFCFSSRRRHTTFSRDWSSDVCSSDLCPPALPAATASKSAQPPAAQEDIERLRDQLDALKNDVKELTEAQIGRASCRERVERSVLGGSTDGTRW